MGVVQDTRDTVVQYWLTLLFCTWKIFRGLLLVYARGVHLAWISMPAMLAVEGSMTRVACEARYVFGGGGKVPA
jgi:hypothetical protein